MTVQELKSKIYDLMIEREITMQQAENRVVEINTEIRDIQIELFNMEKGEEE